MNPAELVVKKFGGVRPAARAIGVNHATVCKWRSNGRVPLHAFEPIFHAARVAKIKITLENLYYGDK